MKYTAGNKVVGFNPEAARKKSEAEFIEHEKGTGLSEKQLKEAYSLMNPKKKIKPEQKD